MGQEGKQQIKSSAGGSTGFGGALGMKVTRAKGTSLWTKIIDFLRGLKP